MRRRIDRETRAGGWEGGFRVGEGSRWGGGWWEVACCPPSGPCVSSRFSLVGLSFWDSQKQLTTQGVGCFVLMSESCIACGLSHAILASSASVQLKEASA